MKMWTKFIIASLIIFCNIGCDQITKEQAREEIEFNETVEVFQNNFVLTKVENTSAALNLGENLSPTLKIIVLQILPGLALLFMFIYILRKKQISKLNIVAFSFIIGGGIGNIYDRIFYNSVTDFMYMEIGSLHTGIFNMADVSVVVGTLLVIFSFIKSEFKTRRISPS